MEVREYLVPEEKLYCVVELMVDDAEADSGDDEPGSSLYACAAATKWLSSVTRAIEEDDTVRYYGDFMWPEDEGELLGCLQKPRNPPPSHWVIRYRIRVLKFCVTLGEAKTISKQATTKSDFTDSDSSRKRKRFRRPFTQTTLDSESENESDVPLSGLKITTDNGKGKPSRFKRIKLLSKSPDKENVDPVLSCQSQSDSSSTNVCRNILPGTSMSLSQGSTPNVRRSLLSNTGDRDAQSANSPATTTPSVEPHTPRDVRSDPQSVPSPPKKDLGVSNRSLLRQMQELQNKCDRLAIVLNKIYNTVCPVLETTQDNGRGLPHLPNSSFEEIIVWEKFLHDHDNSLHVVRLLADRCSAITLRDSINSMLRFMLTNKLACCFNLKGKNKTNAIISKVPFEGSRSWTLILAGVTSFKKNFEKTGTLSYSITPSEVGLAVGKWLKDAPKRYMLDLKCDKVLPATATRIDPELFLTPPECFNLSKIP